MRNNPKNFSVKIIKGNAYIYSWSYRKISYRSATAFQRYHWKYRGRYGTRRVKDFMKRLSVEEKQHLREEVQKKLKIHKRMQQQIESLLQLEPFKTRYGAIIAIKNRINREHELKKLYSELNSIVKKNGEAPN
ncbi:hypothetical protein ABE033_10400 [Priestia megaterium]